jgi:hypothetical protein
MKEYSKILPMASSNSMMMAMETSRQNLIVRARWMILPTTLSQSEDLKQILDSFKRLKVT